MTETTVTVEQFMAAVSLSLRQTLYRKMKDKGLSQDQITQIVASATNQAIEVTGLTDLATLAVAAGPIVSALTTSDPENPALASFAAAKDAVRENVKGLYETTVEEV